MFIRENRIREIIREELISVLYEVNPFHDKEGHFTSKDKSSSYSLTNAAKSVVNKDLIKKAKSNNGVLSYRFGMATGDSACGRKDISGKNRSPKRSCSKYPDKYYGKNKTLNEDEIATTDITDVEITDDEVACIRITDLVDLVNKHRQTIDENVSSELDRKCRSLGYTTFEQLIKSLDALVRSSKGELNKAVKW